MDIPVYVVHYSPLKERRTFMEEQFKKYNISATFETEYDREDLTEKDLSQFRWHDDKLCIKHSEASLACKQMSIYRKIVENKIDVAVIFEDDVMLFDDFLAKFMIYYYELPEDWDILFFGSGWNLHVPEHLVKSSDKNVFLKNNNGAGRNSPMVQKEGWPSCGGSTRCLDSYVITYSAAKRIMEYIEKTKIHCPFDIFLNGVYRNLKLNVYWGEPSLCKQDCFESSLKKPEN